MKKNRTRQYSRMQERAHIARKKRIAKRVYRTDLYKHDHQYSKNKIHCSCSLCRFAGLTYSDMKKEAKAKYDITVIKDENEIIDGDAELYNGTE